MPSPLSSSSSSFLNSTSPGGVSDGRYGCPEKKRFREIKVYLFTCIYYLVAEENSSVIAVLGWLDPGITEEVDGLGGKSLDDDAFYEEFALVAIQNCDGSRNAEVLIDDEMGGADHPISLPVHLRRPVLRVPPLYSSSGSSHLRQ